MAKGPQHLRLIEVISCYACSIYRCNPEHEDSKRGNFWSSGLFHKVFLDEEVIRLANDSTFGLSASVWTRNTTKGIRFANEIQAGTVWINGEILGAEYPWGGYKESGFVIKNPTQGWKEYVQIKAISFDLAGEV